MTAEQIP